MKKGLLFILIFISTTCFSQSSNEILQRAQAGNAEAQYNLGVMYYEGDGVRQNYIKAKEWFEKAANQGDARAQNYLGHMFYFGSMFHSSIDFPKDYTQARYWYEKAAQQNNVLAQYSLGMMYHDGKGVAQDYTKAREWLEKAAYQFNPNAQFDLGIIYMEGRGTTQDCPQAAQWFEKSVRTTHMHTMTAAYRLADLYYEGTCLPQNYPKALFWYRSICPSEVGSSIPACQKAKTIEAMGYENKLTYQDYTKEWLEKSVQQGDIQAQHILGQMYLEGKGVPQDIEKARYWFQQSCNRGFQIACDEYQAIK